jgi:hypothetical protein
MPKTVASPPAPGALVTRNPSTGTHPPRREGPNPRPASAVRPRPGCRKHVSRGLTVVLLCLACALLIHRPLLADLMPAQSDLDAFMETVLKHRDENWRRLHDYVLREKEEFTLHGPGHVRLFGSEREFTWYMREGYLVRSPVRFDKVSLSEVERRKYEDHWLDREKRREEEHARKAAEKARLQQSAEEPPVTDVESFMRESGEPRFISEAYFLEFKFEPGNYYLAGRETLDKREVLRIEYYPTRLFSDSDDDERRGESRSRERESRKNEPDESRQAHQNDGRGGSPQKTTPTETREEDFERKFNKVALVTLWIDPAVRQIVKFTFENVDFGFLPGRWLLRVGDVRASMEMSQALPDVWLPRMLTFEGEVTLAVGTYAARYTREYFDYRQGEVRAKIRHYGPVREP